MKNRSYSEKLRDPKWQKTRLEVMKRDDFSCTSCKDKESTLNVHHCYYEGYKDPWDYPLESLRTLCESCHKYEEDVKANAIDINLVLREKGYLSEDILELGRILHYMDRPNFKGFSVLEYFLTNSYGRDKLMSVWNEEIKNNGEVKNG